MKVFFSLFCLAAASANAATVLKSDSFEVGDPANYSIQSVTNGSVLVVEPGYPNTYFDSRALQLKNQSGIQYAASSHYNDFLTTFDLKMNGKFYLIADMPAYRNITFHGGGVITYRNPRAEPISEDVTAGTFDPAEVLHIALRTNLDANRWTLWVNDIVVFSANLNEQDNADQLRTIRLQNQYGTAYIDNFTLAAVPVPAAVWLFGSGLAAMGLMRRRRPS